MPLLVVLNELSYRDVLADPRTVDDAFQGLVRVLRAVRGHRTDIALVTEVGLFDILLPGGYSLRIWAADGRNRDALRYLRALRNRAPFREVSLGEEQAMADYTFEARPAEGLGLAHLVGGLAVSLALDQSWEPPRLPLVRAALAEDTTGDIYWDESTVWQRHASTTGHVADHQRWLCDAGLAQVTTGGDLWAAREDLFPHLRFLPRVAGDLSVLRTGWLEPVKQRLAEIEVATARWDPGTAVAPVWSSKVTPDSDSRKHLCYFTDLEGTRMLFDLHARFTPGVGRLHFRLDPAAAVVVVAYIGPKL